MRCILFTPDLLCYIHMIQNHSVYKLLWKDPTVTP